jgi:hypothetical protein
MEERLIISYRCNTLDEIPSLSTIIELPRTKIIKIIFNDPIKSLREQIGKKLQEQLPDFQVGIPLQEQELTIRKLISDSETERHQLFFEQCAKDYRNLSIKLVNEIAQYLKLDINFKYPLETFNPLKRSASKSKGHVGDWFYYLHGFHIGCENRKTKQCLEIPLVYSFEFGALDPYFFSIFIKSTQAYRPLPIDIYEDYADGKAIINKMIALGKFEWINSNIPNLKEAVVTDREKIPVHSSK